MVIKVDELKIFTGYTTSPTLAQRFYDTNAARDLFVIANLVVLKYSIVLYS